MLRCAASCSSLYSNTPAFSPVASVDRATVATSLPQDDLADQLPAETNNGRFPGSPVDERRHRRWSGCGDTRRRWNSCNCRNRRWNCSSGKMAMVREYNTE